MLTDGAQPGVPHADVRVRVVLERSCTGDVHQARRAPSRRGPHVLRWVERLLAMSGAAALLWCACTITNAYIVQWLGRERLKATPSMKTFPWTSSTVQPSVTLGTPLAELSIPSVGLSAVVLQGSDDHTLRLGLGHIETTPQPGQHGNVGIAGHRDTFFRPLRNVQVGDDIWLDTPEERVRYRVSSLRVVNSADVDVIGPTRDATLTLVTCYPFHFIGQAPDRFIVRATLAEAGELSLVGRPRRASP
jgi:sortase A